MVREIGVVVLAVLLGGFALFSLDVLSETATALIAVLVLLNLAVLLIGVTTRVDKHMPYLCDPMVLLCIFLSQFFVLAPILATWTFHSWSVFYRPPSAEAIAITLLAFFVMMTFCLVGYRLRIGVILSEFIPEFDSAWRKLPGRWIEFILLVTCIGASLWWIQVHGGLLSKLSSGYGVIKSPPLFNLSHKALVVATLLIAWRVIHATIRRRIDLWVLGAVLTFDALFFGILVGARKYVLFIFFGILTLFLLRHGMTKLPKARTITAIVLLLAFFTVWGTVRAQPMTILMGQDAQVVQPHARPFYWGYATAVTGPFIGAVTAMEIYPDYEPFKHGRALSIFYLGFIPRAVWPDKPLGLGKEIVRYYEGPLYSPADVHSIAPTVLGGFWVDFGWAGVVAGGLLLGIACRIITAYAVHGMVNGQQLRAARVLIPAVIVIGLGELRADLAALLTTWTLQLAPLLVALAFFDLDDTEPAVRTAPKESAPARARLGGASR